MNEIQKMENLLVKPLWQLTCEEFCELIKYAVSSTEKENGFVSGGSQHAFGVHDLSIKIGCCDSTIYQLRKQGVLDEAIVSQIGRKIVFDVDKARALADEYQQEQRQLRRDTL